MRILFVLNTPGFLRYFDVTIEALLRRGHDVALAFTRSSLRPESLDIYGDQELVPRLLGDAPARTELIDVAEATRAALDYVRYLDPFFAEAEYLRSRRRTRAANSAPWTRMFGQRKTLPRPMVRMLLAALGACERSIPSPPNVDEYLRDLAPDVLVLSPLVTQSSPQTDYVKSARKLHIPCAVCIASWDNLTNKGMMREIPDRVVVWNERQRREAIELHSVPAERVVVTGAQPFDRWFGRTPSCSRATFLERVGLPPDRRCVMFVGSTSNIAKAGVEERFVRDWIGALRASPDPALARAGVLVRPHPDRPGSWEQMELGDIADVCLWPPIRPNSVLREARSDYFDSLYYSDAVVGINTSAMIEAAVIGKPVLTIRTPEFEEAQRGTMHFRYLLPENGGFLAVADGLTEHARQVAEALHSPETGHADRERFVLSFVRPQGLTTPSNDVLVASIEGLLDAEPARSPRRSLVVLPLLRAGAATARKVLSRRDPDRTRILWDRRLDRYRSATARVAAVAKPMERLVDGTAVRLERRRDQKIEAAARRRDQAEVRARALHDRERLRAAELLAGKNAAEGGRGR